MGLFVGNWCLKDRTRMKPRKFSASGECETLASFLHGELYRFSCSASGKDRETVRGGYVIFEQLLYNLHDEYFITDEELDRLLERLDRESKEWQS